MAIQTQVQATINELFHIICTEKKFFLQYIFLFEKGGVKDENVWTFKAHE